MNPPRALADSREQISVEEAKAKGIDVEHITKTDAPTDATSPVGTKPPAAGVAALDEKLADLKVGDKVGVAGVPLPNGEPPKSESLGPSHSIRFPIDRALCS